MNFLGRLVRANPIFPNLIWIQLNKPGSSMAQMTRISWSEKLNCTRSSKKIQKNWVKTELLIAATLFHFNNSIFVFFNRNKLTFIGR